LRKDSHEISQSFLMMSFPISSQISFFVSGRHWERIVGAGR
jgi:hypothetical protein